MSLGLLNCGFIFIEFVELIIISQSTRVVSSVWECMIIMRLSPKSKLVTREVVSIAVRYYYKRLAMAKCKHLLVFEN